MSLNPPPVANNPTPRSYQTLRGFLLLVFTITAARLAYLIISPISVSGDEAQYWLWGLKLDYGYYSKPPLLGWALGGIHRFGVSVGLVFDGMPEVMRMFFLRAGSSIVLAIASIMLYLLGTRLDSRAAGWWAGVSFLTLPAVFLASNLASTDPYMLCCASISLYFLYRALHEDKWIFWLLAGVGLGFALLAKYAAIFYVVSLAIYLLGSKEHRKFLATPKPYALLFIALLCLSPNLWWNYQQAFITFEHTGENANLGGQLFRFDKLAEFLGSQFGVVGPILFAALLGALFTKRKEHWFLWCFTVVPLAVITCQAFLSRANANWAALTYVAGTLLVCVTLRQVWLKRSLMLNLAVGVLAFGYLALFHNPTNADFDPLKRVKGFDEVAVAIQEFRQKYPDAAILTNHRMQTALWHYHGVTGPIIKWDADQHPDDHYEMNSDIHDHDGPFLFVVRDDNLYHLGPGEGTFAPIKVGNKPAPAALVDIAKYFEHTTGLTSISIATHPHRALYFEVHLLEGFKGYDAP